MPTKLSREQADIIINMFEEAKDFVIGIESDSFDNDKESDSFDNDKESDSFDNDKESDSYDNDKDPYNNIDAIDAYEIRETSASDSVSKIKEKLKSDTPELELEEKLEEFFTPLEIAISINNREAFDTLMSLGANPNGMYLGANHNGRSSAEGVSMLGLSLSNYALVYQEGNEKSTEDAVHITKELIKKSSLDILLNPLAPEDGAINYEENKPGHTILHELASFEGTPDKSLYIATMERLKTNAPDKMEAFVLTRTTDGETVLHNLASEPEHEIEFANIILDALSPESAEKLLTAENDLGQNIRDNNYLSKDDGKKWYDQRLADSRSMMDKKAKAFEEELLEELDKEKDKNDKKAEKNRKKKEKKKLRKEKKQQSEEVATEEEPSKESEKKLEDVANETPQTEQVTKEETKPASQEKDEVKLEATKVEAKEETNEQLYQRFADAVLGDASLSKIGTIQKEINKRDDRKGFDEFLARTSESGSIREILIDTIETDERFRNEKGDVSNRSQKIMSFIDPDLKKQINPERTIQDSADQQQRTAQVSTNTALIPPETVTDKTAKTEQSDTSTATPSTKEETVDEPYKEAQRPVIPENNETADLLKTIQQLTQEKAELERQVRQQDEALRYQQVEIESLCQQSNVLYRDNQQLIADNQILYEQTQLQALQINNQTVQMDELGSQNRSLQAVVQASQTTFQERIAPKAPHDVTNAPHDASAIVQERNEMILANQAIKNGKNFDGNSFVVRNGEFFTKSGFEKANGQGKGK